MKESLTCATTCLSGTTPYDYCIDTTKIEGPLLSDEVITLRPLAPGDAAAFARELTDPDLGGWVETPSGDLHEDAKRLIAELLRGREWGRSASFGSFDRDTGALEVLVVAMMPDDPEVAEVAYWVRPESRRRGYASRALRLISKWAISELSVRRLWLEIEPGNDASHGVARAGGYVREGVARMHCRDRVSGVRHDCVIYSLLPSDFDSA